MIAAKAGMPAFKPSSSAASLVIEAVIVTVGDTSIVTCVVVAPGFTVLIVPAIWLRAESFIIGPPLRFGSFAGAETIQCQQMFAGRDRCIHLDRTVAFDDRLAGCRQDCAATAAATRRGFNDWCAETGIQI